MTIMYLLYAVFPINAGGWVSDDVYERIDNYAGKRLYNEILDISIEKDTTKKSTVFVSIKNMHTDTIYVPSKYFVDTRDGAKLREGHINVYACKDSVPILEGDTIYYAQYKDCVCSRKYFGEYHEGAPVFEIMKEQKLIKIPPQTTIRYSFWYPFIRNAYSFLRIQGRIFPRFGHIMPFVINTNVLYYGDLGLDKE